MKLTFISTTFLFSFFILLTPAQASFAEEKKSLTQAYQAAIERAESIEIQKELLIQAQENESQAEGALLPTINGTWNRLQQPTPSNATASAFYPSTQNLVKITATQPLFRGLSEYAALRKTRSLSEAQTFSLLDSAKRLFFDVSTAYYQALNLKQDLLNYKQQLQLNHQRLQELEGFIKIGRAKLTDLLTFKANIASIEAQIEATQGQYENAKDLIAFLTGWDRDALLEDVEKIPQAPAALETYLARIENRADVQLALSNAKANEELPAIARGAHFPSVNLLGNYYLTRPGVLSTLHWDVQLALNFPIFQGGVIQSQLRQAQSIDRQYQLILSQTRRSAEQEVRTLHNLLQADLKQLLKLEELVESSKKNYETQLRYYRNGLVTNLDVLQSMTTFEDAQRLRDHQKYVIKLDSVKLQAATGGRSEIQTQPWESSHSKP
jgi:outer membrane protein